MGSASGVEILYVRAANLLSSVSSDFDKGDVSSFGLINGFHAFFFAGVLGASGNSTVKLLRNGHGVFSNSKTFANTSLSSSTWRFSILLSFGTSIRQY